LIAAGRERRIFLLLTHRNDSRHRTRSREAEPLFGEALRIRMKRFGKDAASTKRALDLYRQTLESHRVKVTGGEAIALASKEPGAR
jgi:hypothetical protein